MAYLPRDPAKTKVLTRPWPRSDLAGPFDDDEKHRTAKQQNKVGKKIKQTCLSSKGSLIPLGNNANLSQRAPVPVREKLGGNQGSAQVAFNWDHVKPNKESA